MKSNESDEMVTISSKKRVKNDVFESSSSSMNSKSDELSDIKKRKKEMCNKLSDLYKNEERVDISTEEGVSTTIQNVSDCEDEEDEEERNERIKFLKEVHKMRRGERGINARKLMKEEEIKEEDVDETDEIQYGLLDKQFTNKSDPLQVQRDKHLEEYLARHLNKKQTEKQKESSVEEQEEAELYKIPEHLKVKDTLSKHAEKINWVTGLVEVPISLESKLKSIEATEKAKRSLLKLGKFNERVDEKKAAEQIVKTAFGPRFQHTDPERSKTVAATDDAVLNKFRRNFNR